MPKIISFKLFLIVLLLSLASNGLFWSYYLKTPAAKESKDQKKIDQIESYLKSISPAFINAVQALAKDRNVPSWGCGPSSYALAKIINKKFFASQLAIDNLYDNEPYEIIERFGLVKYPDGNKQSIGDHAWIEIYLGDRLLFVDPTIAQYGRTEGIVFEAFKIGDPDIKKTLLDKYGIIDDRISILVRKVQENIPINQPPYPGFSIDPQFMDYYLGIVKIRNTVSLGREPIEYTPWVSYLTDKFK